MANQPSIAAAPLHRDAVGSIAAHLGLWAFSAGLLALIYPWPAWSFYAWFALAPVGCLAKLSDRPWRLFWTGLLVALAWWSGMLFWLWPVTIPGYLGLSFYLALHWPLAMLIFRGLVRRWRIAATLALPMAWTSVELLRGYFPAGGLTWFYLGHALGPTGPSDSPSALLQAADLGGELTLSFLLAMTSGLIVDLLTRRWLRVRHRSAGLGRGRGRRFSRTIVAGTTIWLVCSLGALAYGHYRLGQSKTWQASDVVVAAIQTNVPQDNKNQRTEDQDAVDWADLIALTYQAVLHPKDGRRPDVVVWPETTVPRPVNLHSVEFARAIESDWGKLELLTYDQQIRELVRELDVFLLAGSPAAEGWRITPDAQGRYAPRVEDLFNAVVLYRPDGSIAPDAYYKMHRVPFGEYMPWIDDAPWLKTLFLRYLSPYDFDYSIRPGTHPVIFKLDAADGQGVLRVATPICFEDAVARVCRRMVYDPADGEKRADALVNLTNDAWYLGPTQRPQHLQMAAFRCVENRVSMIRAVNTGVSAVIDPAGRVAAVVQEQVAGRPRVQRVAGSISADLSLDPRRTLYSRLGDAPWWVMAALTALLATGGLLRDDGPAR
ncbi:MAG: apolipoprotein N-acyltransferase [Phycisphaeraceae bacterium]|nr:apolipoprotein N-acyltransferase [Phycisphaeraceae bacterium]